jgi:hypothetical protein
MVAGQDHPALAGHPVAPGDPRPPDRPEQRRDDQVQESVEHGPIMAATGE